MVCHSLYRKSNSRLERYGAGNEEGKRKKVNSVDISVYLQPTFYSIVSESTIPMPVVMWVSNVSCLFSVFP
jgi:hypothetical protein